MVDFGMPAGTVLRRQQPLAGRVELWLETATWSLPLRSTREPSMPPTFAALGVPARLCARLDELGIAEPFPVQAATIPDALAGRDLCGKAPTGSGKTIAFGLPLLARVGRARARPTRASSGRPNAMVLPEPVGALPHTSRPARASGMVAAWTGNGSVIPSSSRRAHRRAGTPRSAKVGGMDGSLGRGRVRGGCAPRVAVSNHGSTRPTSRSWSSKRNGPGPDVHH